MSQYILVRVPAHVEQVAASSFVSHFVLFPLILTSSHSPLHMPSFFPEYQLGLSRGILFLARNLGR